MVRLTHSGPNSRVEAQQYAVQSTVVYVWAITGSIQLMVLIILEVLHPVAIDEALHSSALV